MIASQLLDAPLHLIKYWDEHVVFPIRHRILIERLAPHLEGARRVLDLGASDGRLARRLADAYPGTEMVGVDVHVQPTTFIPITKYDGVHLPFEDNSFDTVMLIDVLHHDDDPERVLAEACRVTAGKILIKDHYWNTKVDFGVLSVADYIGNAPYGVRLPYNFFTMSRWHETFENLGLKLIATEMFRFSAFDPTKQVIFVLEEPNA